MRMAIWLKSCKYLRGTNRKKNEIINFTWDYFAAQVIY